ncbi:MAG: ComEC/Rec2 family competence protein [bacterium]
MIFIFTLKYKYRKIEEFVLNLGVCFLLFLTVLIVKKYIFYESNRFLTYVDNLSNFVEEVMEFNVQKIRSGYVILENKEYFKAIVYRSKLESSLYKNEDSNKIFEGSKIVAFVKMYKIPYWENEKENEEGNEEENQKNSFFFSNRIVYKIYEIDVIGVDNGKNYLKVFIFNKLDKLGEGARIIKGIVFGVEDYSFYEKKELIEAGIYHFFVASGSNIFLAMNFFLHFFYFLFFRDRLISLVFASVLTLGYCWVAGFDPPLLRAFLFSLFTNIFLVYKVKDRLFFSLLSSCFVWLFFLIIDFFSTYSLSFKLSFVSFLGVIFLGAIFSDFFKGKKFWDNVIFDNLLVNFAVMLFSFPIFLNYFGVLYLNGLIGGVLLALCIPVIFNLTFIYLILPVDYLGFVNLIFKSVFNFFVFVVEFLKNIKAVVWNMEIGKIEVIFYYFLLAFGGKLIEIWKNKK